MRILHTVSNYWPEHGGGATEVVQQISERLVRLGHSVTVATKYSAQRAAAEFNGVKIRQFMIDGIRGQSILGIRGEIMEYQDYLTKGDFDVIMNYAAQTWHTDLMLKKLGQITPQKILCACGFSGLIGWRRIIYWMYFERMPRYLQQYDMVVYHSANYRDKLFGDRHGVTNYRVIPNGVDGRSFEEAKTDFRHRYRINTPYLLLTVGDHARNKGHSRVIAAFNQLKRTDATLVIIGRNLTRWPRSCWNECRRAAARRDGRILLLRDAPREDVKAAFKGANVFLSGSYIEAFPLVILEAMASAVPFICFPAGNVNELHGGRVVGSVKEMAQEINRLLDSRSLCLELGLVGKNRQKEVYEWDIIVKQYERLYLELCRRVQEGI